VCPETRPLPGRGERRAPVSRWDRPKSPTFTAPSASMKQFDGLMSRCSTPAACAASSPPMMSITAATASSGGTGPLAATRSFSVPPGSNSIEIAGMPSISSLPKIYTVCG
jgi:hypothetical protein